MPEDYGRFEKAMGKLSGIYSKELTPEAMQGYIRALRDLPIELIEQKIESHIRYAKFFPKPVELRPKEERPAPKDPASEATFHAAEQRAIKNLEELRRTNPTRWLEVVRPKVMEMGLAKGMLPGQIEAKLHSALTREGPIP